LRLLELDTSKQRDARDILTDPNQNKVQVTGALEDYLETILLLVRENGFARVKDIVKAREVKAGSVSPALKRLSDLGLVKYVQREYVGLTAEGEQAALKVLARHELLKRFFTEVLQMPQTAAENEACAIEHSLSSEAMDRFVRFFEFLSACPEARTGFLDKFHACPISKTESEACNRFCTQAKIENRSKEGKKNMSMSSLMPGKQGRITHVGSSGAIRQRLLDMGLLPDVLIKMERTAPTGDPIWVSTQGTQIALRREEAESVLVRPV